MDYCFSQEGMDSFFIGLLFVVLIGIPPLKIDERKNFEKLFFLNRILKGDFKLGRCYQNNVNILKVEWDTCQY